MRVLCSLLVLASVLLFSAVPAQAQRWVMDVVRSNPDSTVAALESEMERAEGEAAPSFRFHRLAADGAETLSDYAGRTVVVNFWKTNCSGCKEQFPDLSKLQNTYADQGLAVIYVSPQGERTIRRFWEARDLSGTVAQINRETLSRPYQVLATPSAFVVGPNGTVQETWIGPKTFEQLKELVKPYLSAR